MQLQNNQIGGFVADGLYRMFGFKMPVMDIQNCVFEGSRNSQSVAIFHDINVRIANCLFRNNTQGRSVVTISVGSQINVIIKNSKISNNNMTGLTILSGPITFLGNNTIENNNAIRGGAINILELSIFGVYGTLTLRNNTARKFGGAIYQSNGMNLPTIELGNNASWCTLFPAANSSIVFSGNRAGKGGSDLYGAKLTDCYVFNQYIQRIGRPNETSWYFDAPSMKKFRFINSDQLSSMTSNPIMVCFCNSSNLPDCSDRLHRVRTYPGLDFNTSIATVGYYGGTSPGVVTVDVINATLVRYYGQQETTKCFAIHVLLQNPTPTSALVDIRVKGGLQDWGAALKVDIEDCPLGFYKSDSSGQCECVPLIAESTVTCNVSFVPFQFLRSGNKWLSYLNNTKCITVAVNCPFDYCNQSLVQFDMTRPDHQCAANRTGILCGQCCYNQSLMLGSNHCDVCSNFYLFLLPVFALAGILLVAVLMFLNLTVSVGTINGLLFYANIIKLNEAFFFPDGNVPVVSQFISWLNLDLGIEVCLFDGLDGYWKTWLQFAFPAYLFLLMGGIILGCRYSVWLCRLCGSHAVPALATLFLMSYTKILLTVTNALSMSRLPCNDSMLTVWSVDGNIEYGSGKHLPLVIFSSAVLVIGLAFPVLLLCAPLLERYSHKCIPYRWNPVPSLKPLLDAYGGPYKDNYRFWTGVTLVLRFICTIIFSFISGSTTLINTYIISTIVLGILTAWIFMTAVYRNTLLNILEVFFLINLFLVSNASHAAVLFNFPSLEKASTIISIGFCMICFVVIVIVHCLTQTRMKTCLATANKSREVPQLAAAGDDNERKRVSGSPPLHVYGTERGLHRFVLKFPRPFVKDNNDSTSLSSPVLMEREPLLHEQQLDN